MLYLFSCGNDSTTNTGNGNGGETVIFSMDSLALYIPIMGFSRDTNIMFSNLQKSNISFNCITNTDSINSFASFKVYALDDTIASANTIIDTLVNNLVGLNSNYSTNFITNTNFAFLKITLQCLRNDTNSYYIKLNHIKVTKVN